MWPKLQAIQEVVALLQIVLRPVNVKGFVVLPKRWIVERTFRRAGALSPAQQGL